MVLKAENQVSQIRNARSGSLERSRGHLRPVEDLDATLPIGPNARVRAPEVLPMRCLRCQGAVEQGTAPVYVDREGYRMAWEQVPAWVCTRCELAYFEPEEVATVRRALAALRRLGLDEAPEPQEA
jgi:YgiT-type zinc finger domain-containing protein